MQLSLRGKPCVSQSFRSSEIRSSYTHIISLSFICSISSRRYYEPIMLSLAFVIPTLIPVYCWNESWYCAIHSVIIRYVWLLNATFLVNSFAHMWGNRPYNRYVCIDTTPNLFPSARARGMYAYIYILYLLIQGSLRSRGGGGRIDQRFAYLKKTTTTT